MLVSSTDDAHCLFRPFPHPQTADTRFDWSGIAGYAEQKQAIEDTIFLSLVQPEVFEQVARGTRAEYGGSGRARAVLFEGPPGTGKVRRGEGE